MKLSTNFLDLGLDLLHTMTKTKKQGTIPNDKKILVLLNKVLWDYDVTDRELLNALEGKSEIGGLNADKLKARLLNSYNWFTLVNELGLDTARELLKPEVIRYLYPKSLRSKYTYAARLLHQ